MCIYIENTNQMKTMRKNLKLLRKRKGWSVGELAQILGIDEKVLIDIESGKDFDVEFLFMLCRVYNIKPHEIFSLPDIDKQ